MADRVTNSILSAFLKSLLITNIVILMVGMVILFVTTDAYSVYATSICSASALFNCIGLTLIMRGHKCGVLFVLFPSLLSSVAISVTCAGWLTYSFGGSGIYIPFVIFALYTGILLVLLFQKDGGKSSWQKMDSSLDLAHFRHIYQLSSVILLFIFISAYFVMPTNTESEILEEDDVDTFVSNVSRDRLDSPDITIEEVVSFEKEYNKSTSVENRDKIITCRIYALKHLLLSGLMPDIHDRDNLVNICMIHAGEFSSQQQEIIDWYLTLNIPQQTMWNVCNKVSTLSEFQKTVQNRIID